MSAGGRNGRPSRPRRSDRSDRSGGHGGRRWWLPVRGGRSPRQEAGPPAGGPEASGCVPIRDCTKASPGRPVVRVRGTLRTVSEHSVAGLPALQAELDDGSAALAVVWLGRRAITGVEPGRSLVVSGRISMTRGRPVLFNPRYELQPRG